MGRTQWKLFGVGMFGVCTTGVVCAFAAQGHPALLLIPFSFLLLTLGSTLGWSLFSWMRDALNRRHGVEVVGRVIHARSSGYSNRVPTWEVEATLPDGTTTHLLVNRFLPFTPGEPILLVVNPRDPGHAALPRGPSLDF